MNYDIQFNSLLIKSFNSIVKFENSQLKYLFK